MSSPVRMCICCRKHGEKSDFVRIVRNKKGEIRIVSEGYAEGRGAYICKNTECIEQAKKRRVLNRSFRENVSEAVYDEILSIIDGGGCNGY